jgi:putative aldouronate transport system permease protein
MVEKRTLVDLVFDVLIHSILALLCIACVAPLIHVIAVSFSSKRAIGAAQVGLWPVGLNLQNYMFIGSDPLFVGSFVVSLARVIVGVGVTLLLTVLTAYPLSRDTIPMPGRTLYKSVMIFSMLFSGGLIPTYLAMDSLGLVNKFAILILPGAFNVFYTILIMNFFRGLPQEMWEAAMLDGAGHLDVLLRILLPLSMPSLATVALFSAVAHWNSWFDALVYLKNAEDWPLQTYLYGQVTTGKLHWMTGSRASRAGELFQQATPEGLMTAMLLIAVIPIILVYPFLQRYFVHGLTLGAVKE